jgi:peptide/nickel transport system permease protein
MLRLIAGQVLGILISLLVVSFGIFVLVYIAPGDPLAFLASGSATVPPEVLEALREQYGLNDPFFVRYADWLTNVVQGDLGTSIVYREEVVTLLEARAGTTLYLVSCAAVLCVGGGIAIGTLAALRGGMFDRIAVTLTAIGIGTPTFVGAILLTSIFSVNLGWFPALGHGDGFFDRLYHMVLPAVALAIPFTGIVARITRAAVRGEMTREHVETARSRGIPESFVIRRHVLRNALIPISTVGALVTAGLISGAVIVERAFGLDGIGSFLVESVERKDFPVVQAIALVLLMVFVVVNGVVEAVYRIIDPRVRASR